MFRLEPRQSELETYEQHRTQKPVTVPVLIERASSFVLDVRVGALAGRVKPGQGRHRPGRELERESERKSESRQVVKQAFELLRAVSPRQATICVLTDKKPTYPQLLKELFGERCVA